MAEYEDVASLHQIRDGGVLFVDVGESEAMLFRSGETVKAYGAYCTHAFASLRDAKVERTIITCARHGARFDLATGRAVSGGCPNLPSYAVKREGLRVLVKAG